MDDQTEHSPRKIDRRDLLTGKWVPPSPERQNPQVIKPPRQSILEEKISKRGFLKRLAWPVGGLALGYPTFRVLEWATNLFTGKGTKKLSTKPVSTPTSIPLVAATREEPKAPEALPEDITILNRILATPLADPQRERTEEIYANRAQNLTQVDMGLFATANPQLRERLLRRRFELRQTSKDPYVRDKLTALTPELLEWAQAEHIPPEVLGMCLDTYHIAKRVIQKLIDRSVKDFRPDLFDPDRFEDLPPDIQAEVKAINEHPGEDPRKFMKNLNAERLMINIGGMAMLMNYETGGFVNIGNGAALEQLKGNYSLNAQVQLEDIAHRTSKITGLNFTAANIPGSVWTPQNVSGGAIGPQFMPGAALEMMDLFKDVRETLNIFHPSWAIIASWVFLARSQFVEKNKEGKNRYREGFLEGGEDFAKALQEFTLGKWNPHENQIQTVIRAQNSFHSKFKDHRKLAKAA